jgi:hypothetical protein
MAHDHPRPGEKMTPRRTSGGCHTAMSAAQAAALHLSKKWSRVGEMTPRPPGGRRRCSVLLCLRLQTLMWVTLASVVVYLAYNTAGMYVTEELGAVTRTVRVPHCRKVRVS